MRSASDAAIAAAVLVGLLGPALPGRSALAQEHDDPSHGRIDGDVSVVVGLGTAVAPQGVRGEGEVRLRYLDTAGAFATYEEGALFASTAQPQRVLTSGAELRPLFLARWLRGYETRSVRFDLAVDSLGFELAAVFAQHAGGAFASDLGVQVGLGLEVPLLERPSGPWVGMHGGVRWSDAALASGVVHGATNRAGFLVVTLAWHELVVAHLVDLGDEAPR